MVRDQEQTDSVREGEHVGELVTAARDPHTLAGFCCGQALPVVDSVPAAGKATYTACPVWRAEKRAVWANQERVVEEHRPPDLPLGMHEGAANTLRLQDPLGLDVLAGDAPEELLG